MLQHAFHPAFFFSQDGGKPGILNGKSRLFGKSRQNGAVQIQGAFCGIKGSKYDVITQSNRIKLPGQALTDHRMM